MSLVSDQSLSLDSSAGYTFTGAEVEFVEGGARLKTSFTGSSVIQTPALDISDWTSIHNLAVTAREQVGYYHKFLFSFDGGTTWKTRRSFGWQTVTLSDFSDKGMSVQQVEGIRDWLSGTSLIFAIRITREVSGGTGLLDQLEIFRGTRNLEYSAESAGKGELHVRTIVPAGSVHHLGIFPDYPIREEITQGSVEQRTEMGHIISIAMSFRLRAHYPDLSWTARDEAEKDEIVDVLRRHQDTPLLWTSPFYRFPKSFVCAPPEFGQQDVGVWFVRSSFIEWLAPPVERGPSYFRHAGNRLAKGLRQYLAGQLTAADMTTRTPPIDTVQVFPFFAPRAGTIEGLSVFITTPAGTGGVGKIGIYENLSIDNPYPGALLYSSPEFSTEVSTQILDDVRIVTDANQLFWMAIHTGVDPAEFRATARTAAHAFPGWDSTLGAAPPAAGISKSQAYGSLPDPYPSGGSSLTDDIPAIALHYAELN